MNFLLRSASSATHRPPVSEPPPPPQPPPEATLERAEEPFLQYTSLEDHIDGSGDDHGNGESNANTGGSGVERFSDVSEEEGWISIPYRKNTITYSKF